MTDKNGRKSVNVATQSNLAVINSIVLIHGRYRLRPTNSIHQSPTCIVFEAFDEGLLEDDGNPPLVALKFMTVKGQFIREVDARSYEFNSACVIDVLRTHPDISSCTSREEIEAKLVSLEEVVQLEISSRIPEDGKKKAGLTKQAAEKMYLVVMPLAEMNLFVATKQERRDEESTKHVFRPLLTTCIARVFCMGT